MFQIVNISNETIKYEYKYNDDLFGNIGHLEVIEDNILIGTINTSLIIAAGAEPGIHIYVLYSENIYSRINYENLKDNSIVFSCLPSHHSNISFEKLIQRIFEYFIIYDSEENIILTLEDIINTSLAPQAQRANDFYSGYYYRIIITDEIINEKK